MDQDSQGKTQEESIDEASGNPMPERILEFSIEWSHLNFKRVSKVSLPKAYPTLKTANSPLEKGKRQTVKESLAPRVKKSSLNDVSQAKWSLFDKTIALPLGKPLGEDTSKSEILKIFRQYLKANHPDATRASNEKAIDFALMVRIKDELIAALPIDSN